MRKENAIFFFAILFLILGLALFSDGAPAWAAPEVITVPANSADPAIPHLAYNGHKTTLKAIARGFASVAEAQSARFRWDIDGDGSFDDEPDEVLRQCVDGTPEGTTCYDLGKTITIPTQATNRFFHFTVRLSIPGQPDVFATYPIFVRADVPAQTDPSNNGTALPQNATDEQLEVMRAVAVDEALWYQHLNIANRAGTGAAITGNIPTTTGAPRATAAAALLLYEKTGHPPAYPAGTYSGASPAGFADANDFRWNNDPYAEDGIRLFNYLLSGLNAIAIDTADEADDGTTPIPGTNDGIGLSSHFGSASFSVWADGTLPLAAISYSGLAGTVAQVGHATYVQGRSIEFIVQQMADYIVYAQIDTPGLHYGGWYYFPNGPEANNHEDFVRGIFMGLSAAHDGMRGDGVYVNNRVRNRAMSYFKYNQDSTSKLALYVSGSRWLGTGNFSETGDTLIALGFLGWSQYNTSDATVLTNDYAGNPITRGQARQIFNDYVTGVGSKWLSFQVDGDNWVSGLFYNDNGTNSTPYLRTDRMGNLQSMFGFAEAFGTLPNASDFSVVANHNWKREFSTYLIRNQFGDGHWLDALWPIGSVLYSPRFYGPVLSTSYAGLTLTPNWLILRPVAMGSASPLTVMEGCYGEGNGTVTFGHANSFHLDPSGQIAEYQWVFDMPPGFDWNSVNWSAIPDGSYSADGKAWRGTDPNATPTYQYSLLGTYTAALRVVDNNNPAKTDVFKTAITALASQNLAPTVSAGGPYVINLGDGLTLNGSASDPNEVCGDTLRYEWDLNGDNVTDATTLSPSFTAAQLQALNPPLAGGRIYTIKLTAIDSFGVRQMGIGASTTATTTLTILDNVPFAIAAATPLTATCGQAVTFDGSGSFHGSPSHSIVNYEWDFDFDGVFAADASGIQTTHGFISNGTHNVLLRVTDDNVPPKTAFARVYVTVNAGNMPPVANAGGPYNVELGQTAALTGSASADPNAPCGDSIVSYYWKIDNGAIILTGAAPPLSGAQIAALGVGTHSVQLTVTDTFGATGTASTTLTITNSAPVASFTAQPNPAACGQTVQFDGTGSSGQGISYAWSFGDGATATGAAVTHAYTAYGTYTATLTVTDSSNPPKTATSTGVINVNQGNVAPIANAGGPYTADLGSTVVLNGSGSTDPNTSCGDSIVIYQWSIGKGAINLTGATPSLSAAQVNALGVGTHAIMLRVTDSFGSIALSSTTLSIYDNTPVASFTVSPNPAACGKAVAFDASGSHHNHPDRGLVSYAWSFGDGTKDSGVTVSHAYSAYGSYKATLTVTDNNNPARTDTSAIEVNINQGNLAPVANAGGPYSIDLGSGLALNGSASSDPNTSCDDSIVSYHWNIGNGTYILTGATPALSAAQVNTLGVGTHSVQLTVTDTFGATGTASTTLTVASPVYRVSGTAFIYPETTAYRATFSIDTVTGPTPTGSLRYYYAKTRMNFVSTGITSAAVSGNTAVINGTGTANGAGGYTFTAVVTDGAPDSFGITVRKPDGSAYYAAGPMSIGGGDLLIQMQ